METNNHHLISALKYYLLYFLIATVAAPILIYSLAFIVDKYISGNETTLESVMNCSALGNVSLITGNLLVIVLFIKKRYTNLNVSEDTDAVLRRNKDVLMWAVLLEVASILPVNLLIGFLNLSDYAMVLASDDALSMSGIVAICLFAPFAEELVFRGGIEEKLLQWKNNAAIAIVLSSFVFALLHLYPSAIIGTFIGSLFTGWVYYRTRNIMVCFFMHLTNNSLSCLLDWMRPDGSSGPEFIIQTKYVIMALFCLIFLAAAIANLKRITADRFPNVQS